MSDRHFSIAREFSPHPGPRYVRHGSNSGEALRKRLLEYVKQTPGRVVIDLDGTKGFGSSFLDEAFGGLIRWEGWSKDEVKRKFEFRSRIDPSYVSEIEESIERAVPSSDRRTRH